jgi:hypothetical protein
MNAYDREISARLGKALLLEILDVARSGKDAHSRLGISRETLDDLTRLNIAELYGVSASPFLHLKVDDRILNLAVQGALKNRNRDELLNKAIRFGASRAIMQEFARLSYNEFRRRRSELGIDTNRSRPQQLTNDEYERLSELHSGFGKHHPIAKPLDHLYCLVYLAEHSNIDINRIHSYYYADNRQLFAVSGGGDKDAA